MRKKLEKKLELMNEYQVLHSSTIPVCTGNKLNTWYWRNNWITGDAKNSWYSTKGYTVIFHLQNVFNSHQHVFPHYVYTDSCLERFLQNAEIRLSKIPRRAWNSGWPGLCALWCGEDL